ADTYTDRDRAVKCLAFTPDGDLSVTGDGHGTVRIFVVAKRERFKGDIPAHAKALADVALTPDKKLLIAGDEDADVKVFDLQKPVPEPLTDKPIATHKNRLMGISVSPDGARFATVDSTGQVRAWETKTGKQVREWDLRMPVGAVTFTADGKHVV